MPRALLISLRLPSDAMSRQERRCFAERAELTEDEVDLHYMVDGYPDLDVVAGYDAVFFGGSGAYSVLDDVAWIKDGIRLCLDVIDRKIPAYASCFGFQGLAVALGGKVVADAARQELGATPLTLTPAGQADALFRTLPREFLAQEGHHDHVVELPRGVTLLATGAVSAYQAFRVDGAPFWASQFHPELTAETTTERFNHYLSHYLDAPEKLQATLHHLQTGQDSPEMAGILGRLVRHEF